MVETLSESERTFVEKAIGRSRIFLVVMWVGLAIGLPLLVHTITLSIASGGDNLGLRAIVAIMILLNARQNLRQHKYAEALRKLYPSQNETA